MTPSVTPPEGPDEAADILAKGAAALEDLFARLRPDIAEARATIGGGTWSARDLAGHIQTWEQVALDTIQDLRAGRRPRLREVVTDEASLDRFNADQVQAKASQSWEEALAALKATTASLVTTVDFTGYSRSLRLQRQMHALEAPILLRVSRLDELDGDAQT